MTRIGIVGGGILGLAVARTLLQRRPGTELTVFEAEDRLAAHQTGHNSGVVHAGIYYRPGSLKAQLCTRGRSQLAEFCGEHRLPYIECGKIVVAVGESELGRFEALARTAAANGVPGLRRVDAGGLREIEPHATGLAALHSPRTAITDYVAICEALAREIEGGGGRIALASPVTGVREAASGVDVVAAGRAHRVDELIMCAGLQSDRVAGLAGGDPEPRIIPFRGEYLRVRAAKQDFVRGMIYPVPDPRYPFLGVHFTRRVDGSLEVGPNAVLAARRDGYRRTSFRAADLGSTLAWPGFWRMAARHWRTGVREVYGSLSIQAFMRSARQYVPDVAVSDVARAGSGVRAQAVDRDGTLVDDFRIVRSGPITMMRNAPSPAATSSLAIAEYVLDQVM
ncbi:MAG: L-2-hydroxyglutarate oxidase [Nocardioidaceae bacterium]